ncbi:MAG: PD40 domain-containing protein [Anaerolineae bacterium]|nr:PD40 domain-containing protein [Anaerolineae bacterium]
MSTVYHAYDPRFKRDVAIKVLPREFLHDPLFRTRFEREAEIIAALEHSAIVPVYDFGEDDGQLYLVMRYMAGGSLADRLEKGPYSLAEIVAVLTRLAPALDKAHAMGVVHRDLKPGNILFDEDNNSCLTDFGIAKLAETSVGLTGTGSMVGTPAYMSPEQARGDATTDGRSDIYSVGVILFEMLTGELPFQADTPMGVAVKHITDPVPRILQLNPDLPPRCEAVIVRSMNKDVEQRYQTCSDLVRDLRSAVLADVGDMDTLAGLLPARPRDTKQLSTLRKRIQQQQRLSMPVWGWVLGVVTLVGISVAAIMAGSGFRLLEANLPVENDATPTSTSTPKTQVAAVTEIITNTPTVTPTKTPIPVEVLGGGGGSMAFVSGPDNQGNIYVVDLACVSRDDLCGPGAKKLTDNSANNRGPVWSPDGRLIAFRSQASGNRDIYMMKANGTGVTQLTTDLANDYSPAWSPDGERIAFVSERDGNPEIYVMDADGSNQLRLTHNHGVDYYPAWSPDGKWIAFYSRRDLNTDIYLLDTECIDEPENCDVGQLRLTNDPAYDYEPTWSPDGSRIAFVSERDGNPEIYIMNADGTDKRRLTENSYADTTPAFSPDGKWIAFISRRDDKWDVYLMGLNGKNERRITKTPENEFDPNWMP